MADAVIALIQSFPFLVSLDHMPSDAMRMSLATTVRDVHRANPGRQILPDPTSDDPGMRQLLNDELVKIINMGLQMA